MTGKILVIGSGGREHAICWKLRSDDPALDLHCAPGNPGIEEVAECHAVRLADPAATSDLAERLRASLVVIGPENPLAAGVADRIRGRGLAVFGPSAGAARIESSKRFAKELMLSHRIPTARASMHTDAQSALRAAGAMGVPLVVKASGLAAGKGVVVCETLDKAQHAIGSFMSDRALGESGAEVLVEEFLEGEELSVFAFCDGIRSLLLLPSQDHKRLLEGDMGPNTGGMGAYAPVSSATPALVAAIEKTIFRPTLVALRETGTPFNGLLYAGLMLTSSGPKVIEFNCRFGDPETQVVLPLMEDRLLPYLEAAAKIDGLDGLRPPSFSNGAAVTTVMAVAGYPEKSESSTAVSIPGTLPDGSYVFHAGTKRADDGTLLTAGGRVLAVTGVGGTLEEALQRSQSAAESIEFDGCQWRRDIGWRELSRQRGSPT